MKLEFPLLGLLVARELTGYDIKKWTEIEGKFSGLDRHPSQIYRELNRMEVDGLIEHERDSRAGVPDAKVYRLTPAGRVRLDGWIQSAYVPPARFQNPEFVIRLRITAMLDAVRVRQLIEEELQARERQVAENRGRDRDLDHLEGDPSHPEIDVAGLAVVADATNAYGEQSIDQWIAFLRDLLEKVDAHARDREKASPKEARP